MNTAFSSHDPKMAETVMETKVEGVIEGATKKLDAHIWEREADEHYVEPEWCSRRLFEEEQFNGQVWDPCCGFGRIPDAARVADLPVYASDLVNRGYAGLHEVLDFLKCTGRRTASNIVCNPPFDIAPQFALHALGLASMKVAMIFPTARLNAAHWLKGTPLRRVWLMSPRPSMPPGHVIARGEKPGGGKMDFCWLVWERGYEGAAELRWLYRDGDRGRELAAHGNHGERANEGDAQSYPPNN